MAGSGANNIKVSPVNVLWRIEASEQIDFTGLTGADVDGKYFLINSAKDAIEYYVWFNAGAADPAPAGKTAIEVTVLAGDTSGNLAVKASSDINSVLAFTSSIDGNKITVNRTDFGLVTDTVDFDSSVSITICRRGKDFNLGLLDGDVELSISPANFIVTAHQTGLTPRAALFQGLETLEATTTMLETQTSQLAEIYGQYGETFTPAAGTQITSIGTSKQGNNVLVDAARLVLKPVNAVDDSENTTMMLAVPNPESLVFSGENPRTLSVTWSGFVDDQIDSRASAFVLGDETQEGLRN